MKNTYLSVWVITPLFFYINKFDYFVSIKLELVIESLRGRVTDLFIASLRKKKKVEGLNEQIHNTLLFSM